MSYHVTVNDVTYSVPVPDGSTSLAIALASIDAWRIASLDVDVIRRIHRPDDCPPAFLPLLAWEYSVDEWNPAWPVTVKRNAVKLSYEIHRHKGTAYGVETAITALDFGAQVEEWFEYDGDPYKFRLSIDLAADEPWSAGDADLLVRTALRTKNARSLLELVSLRRTTPAAAYVGGFIQTTVTARVEPFVISEITARGYLYIGGAISVDQSIRVYPAGAI